VKHPWRCSILPGDLCGRPDLGDISWTGYEPKDWSTDSAGTGLASPTVLFSRIGRLLMSGVITLIKDDHKKLEAVFKKLESAEPADTPPLLQQVAELLIPHSKAEEQVVYPAIKATAPDEESDVDDGIAEHHHVEETLKQLLASDPEAPGADGLIAAMIGEVRHHVEEEEEDILPKFAEAASNEQLRDLGAQFTQAKEQALAELRSTETGLTPS